MSKCVLESSNSIVFVLILLVEAWIGRTNKTKYSSILELVVIGTAVILINKFKKEVK